MLVLRKELKLGLGIGAAILGVAVVYGGMAMLTSDRDAKPAGSEGVEPVATSETTPAPNGLDGAVSGLPPAESPPTETKVPAVDPFAENARTDGNTRDPWALALRTGRVSTDTVSGAKAPETNHGIIKTEAPAEPVQRKDPLVVTPSAEQTLGDTKTVDTLGPAKQAAEGKYIIQPGDSFVSIAGKVYGNRNLYSYIAKANPTLDPTRLKPGMEISVPPSESIKDERKSERGSLALPPESTGTIDASRQYRVQAGDTLSGISQRLYGKTNQWAALYEMNKAVIGPDSGRLKIGTVLSLPQPPSRI
ncbi:MAG TPA: LysM peptidoglycan-binding domain-containing protein [Tepidisphaeraceae bacterium]|jgi:phage tail protein X